MKILLINLCLRASVPKKIFPIGLSYVASAMARSGIKFDLIDIDAYRHSDSELEDILKNRDFDVVAFGCIVTGYKIVKWLSSLIRRINRDAVIIAGNSVASSIPQILLSKTDVDIAIFGEGDITIVELLKCLEDKGDLGSVKGIAYKTEKEIHYTPSRPLIGDIDAIPFPSRDLFPIDIYLEDSKNVVAKPYPIDKEKIRAMPVNSTRGCVYRCTFCYHVFINMRYRYRSPQSIIQEIKELKTRYGANYILLWDDLTFFSKRQFARFVHGLLQERLDIFWIASCRENLLDENDLELAVDAKRSGCVGLGYSIESANDQILKMMGKWLDKAAFVTQKRILDKAGLCTFTSLVLGYPIETEETIKETFDFCYENEIYPSAGFLLPQPGTFAYDYAIKNGFIPDEEEYLLRLGDRQDLRINLTKIPDERFKEIVSEYLDRINKKLGLGLTKESLIRTSVQQARLASETTQDLP